MYHFKIKVNKYKNKLKKTCIFKIIVIYLYQQTNKTPHAMTNTTLHQILSEDKSFDFSIHSTATSDNGMKISIQGRSIEDVTFLYERLNAFLSKVNAPYKMATSRRLTASNKEQAHKAMTIYCPDGVNFAELCEGVYSLTADYKGWFNTPTPNGYQHYAGGLFTRNDRDASGNYIPAAKA